VLPSQLSLFSWNFKGMTIPGMKQDIQGDLQNVKSKIVFLQEVKSSRFDIRGRMSDVWNGSFWATDHD